ncbi:baeRF3 domain-containing protein [Streptomyces zhihengii]|uniref:Chemotaxis protein n=1 Tax=Streptomyces zhihengii TaxID=1818004 RepID=A0ABS2UNF2_9ACTN|nr:chemotaxis protein [Streptomyces zhihengii]MBM9618588.1 chemotaxis protein [Streptomyces zhihengii]
MDTDALTPALLRQLRAQKPYPAVSVTMPTHRHGQDSEQDAVRLRNLMAEAERRLGDDGVDRETRDGVRAQLERAVAELDPRQAQDGLAILADTREYQVWRLPRSVPERVVLSDSFLTRNLVSAKAQARPYWVLVVSADRTTLWSGAGESLHEHTGDGFPRVRPQEQFDPQREERQGDTASTFTDEWTRAYLREVDEAVGAVLETDPRPLFLVGLAPALSLLRDAGTATAAAVGRVVKGGLTDGPAAALLKELHPALDEYRTRHAAAVAGRLDAARGKRSFAAGLDEVWGAVRDERAGLVVVEEHFQRTARVTGGHLQPVDPAAAPDPEVREDIVDELVETALDGGAEVVFVPDGTLSEHGGVAAELRY